MSKSLDGLEETLAALRELDQLTGRNVSRAAVKGAEIALHDAEFRAPVRTGALLNDIEIQPERSKKGKRVFKVGLKPRAEAKALVEGGKYAGVPYPSFVEAGHKQVGGSKVAARPFIKPALDSNRLEIEDEIADQFRAILARAGKKK